MLLFVRFRKQLFWPPVGILSAEKGFFDFLESVPLPQIQDNTLCTLRIEYHASAWEKEWAREVGDLRGDDWLWEKGCARMLRAVRQVLLQPKTRVISDGLG